MISPTYAAFISKYSTQEKLIEELYLKSVIDSFSRVKQIQNIASNKENIIRNYFINDLQSNSSILKNWLDEDIVSLVSEGQVISATLEVSRTDISFFVSGLGYFVIECKNLRSADQRYLSEGLQRFIDLIYSSKDNYAGMLGFIVGGKFATITKNLPPKIQNFHNIPVQHTITVITYSDYIAFSSKHERKNKEEIIISHLLLSFV